MKPNEDISLDDEQLVLGDLLNTVLDKGVVISGQVTISIADIDLVMLDLRLLLSSVQTALERQGFRTDGDVSLLRAELSGS
jgi:gas vesicle structural protein